MRENGRAGQGVVRAAYREHYVHTVTELLLIRYVCTTRYEGIEYEGITGTGDRG